MANIIGQVITSRLGGEMGYASGANGVIFAAMDGDRGDIDVHPEVWLPIQSSLTDENVDQKNTACLSEGSYEGWSRLIYNILGLVCLLLFKYGAMILANWTLEGQFTKWRSDSTLAYRFPIPKLISATLVSAIVIIPLMIKFTRPDALELLKLFLQIENGDWRLVILYKAGLIGQKLQDVGFLIT